jgi:zinc protease
MLVAERILGGATESRMFTVVRQQIGLSYGVGTFFDEGRLDDNSTLGLYAIYAPQNADKVRAAMSDQVKLALDKGFTPEEVDNAKRAPGDGRRRRLHEEVSAGAGVASGPAAGQRRRIGAAPAGRPSMWRNVMRPFDRS